VMMSVNLICKVGRRRHIWSLTCLSGLLGGKTQIIPFDDFMPDVVDRHRIISNSSQLHCSGHLPTCRWHNMIDNNRLFDDYFDWGLVRGQPNADNWSKVTKSQLIPCLLLLLFT
jgi:hypothetical protein